MSNPYDIHSWSKLYEGRLRMARSVPPENHKKGGGEVNDVALRIRIAALVAAVFLSVTGTTLAASTLAGEDRAASAQGAQELGTSVPNTGNFQSTG